MGVHVDQNLSSTSRGIYTFRGQVGIYHQIGSLLPHTNARPRFLQLYIYDIEHEIENRILESESLHRDIVERIQIILDEQNPFVRTFRQLARRPDLYQCKLIIKEQAPNQPQYSLPTASQVAAIVVGGDETRLLSGRDILVQTLSGALITIQDVIRHNTSSLLLYGERLLQQYAVDNYVKMESHKLRWIRQNQLVIWAKQYQGLQDAFQAGEMSIKSIKYLYKYVYKGPDHVSIEVQPAPNYDEIQQYVDARWICAPETFWKIFSFAMYRMYPSVERLQIHQLNTHHRAMLTKFFYMNTFDPEARNYLYREFPKHYCWISHSKTWRRRESNKKVIGRIYTASPIEGGKFYLRVLLNHQVAEQRDLLENDNSIRQCLFEATNIRMPTALRRLFATILVFCQPMGVRELWNEFYTYMVEDYPSSSEATNVVCTNLLLNDLKVLLLQHGKHITNYDLPVVSATSEQISAIPRIIQDEINIPVVDEEINFLDKLNHDQRVAYNTIMRVIKYKESMIFFVDGPGGTGKTFLFRTLLANLRKLGHIAIATATSGIVTTLLPGGRTTHSRFKIPLTPDDSSTCSISVQSDLAKLIRRAIVVVWDEAPMVNRRAVEAFDRTLKDIMEEDSPFGGKVVIFGGDFRQVLPVVPNDTRSEMIDACIVKSPLWRYVKVLHLKYNMRTINDEHFAEYVRRIGDGNESFTKDDLVKGEHSVYNLNEEVFPDLHNHSSDAKYMVDRALLTPINDDVTLHSFDEVEEDTQHLYQQEFLNSISSRGLPPHILRLKKGTPIMLLRNIDSKVGLCNGTRLICRGCFNNVIDAEVLIGYYAVTRVFLPRIPLKTIENVHLPFVMTRRQFPICLSFALTINKAQGQTIPKVALLRGVSQSTTKILVEKGTVPGEEGVHTKNIVYKEVLLPAL
ncbi:hypothetical protein FCV25MIE_24794 [Fagus crenata]